VSELLGVGILVTRPEQQAMPLCRLLAAYGAACYPFPAIEIKPLVDRGAAQAAIAQGDAPDGRGTRARFGNLEQFDWIVFVSANAVRFGVHLLEQKRDLRLAAVGPATARALNHAGYRVAIVPAEGFDSEGLLADPRMQNLAGRRVLIVKGSGGRELLAAELSRRGAIVELAEVYERVPATPSNAELAALEQLFAANNIQVITSTSAEIGASLLRLATPALRIDFERVHWLVPSTRVAEGLEKLGLGAPLIVADSAEDQELASALIRWRSSESGA
jgi:uroporphyrinogen-III synthase